MKISGLILLLFTLSLGGCGTTYSASATADADRRAQAAYSDCTAQQRSGALRSFRQAADCAKPRVLAAYQENGFPYMDLVNLDLAAHAVGAERIDTGFASEADVNRDLAELQRRIMAERQRRLGSERFSGGVAYIPLERFLIGLDSLTSRQLPRSGPNCFTVGNFTRCD